MLRVFYAAAVLFATYASAVFLVVSAASVLLAIYVAAPACHAFFDAVCATTMALALSFTLAGATASRVSTCVPAGVAAVYRATAPVSRSGSAVHPAESTVLASRPAALAVPSATGATDSCDVSGCLYAVAAAPYLVDASAGTGVCTASLVYARRRTGPYATRTADACSSAGISTVVAAGGVAALATYLVGAVVGTGSAVTLVVRLDQLDGTANASLVAASPRPHGTVAGNDDVPAGGTAGTLRTTGAGSRARGAVASRAGCRARSGVTAAGAVSPRV